MGTTQTRITGLVADLADALGTLPRTRPTGTGTRIEADLPAGLPELQRQLALDVLARADRWGHDLTDTASVLWADLDTRS